MNWVKPSLTRVAQVVFGGCFVVFALWFLLFIAAAIKQDYKRQQALDELRFDVAVAECRQAELWADMIGGSNNFVRSEWQESVKARCIARAEYKDSIRAKLGEFWQLTKDTAAYLVE